jgi:hypothetical protein
VPITETKLFNKPIILADLDYAHETLGIYNKVKFFEPNDSVQLAAVMKGMISSTAVFEKAEGNVIPEPFARNWDELFNILLTGAAENV